MKKLGERRMSENMERGDFKKEGEVHSGSQRFKSARVVLHGVGWMPV